MEKLETLKNVVDNAIIGSMCVVGKVEAKKETNSFGRIRTTSLLCSSDGHYITCVVQKEKVGKNYDEIIKNLKIGKEVYLKGSMSKSNIFYVTFASQDVFRMELNHFEETNEIKFHRLIASGDEKGAIELLEQCGDSINVNYECKNRIPVFSAINQRMYNLYEKIVNHPMFDGGREDGFGETLLHSLLYLRGTDEIPMTENDTASLDRMIKTILNNKKYDFNMTDINHDTVINVACEYPKLIWVVEELVNKKDVNPNVINDFDCTALGTAIHWKNIEAIKILATRKDVIVRPTDLEEANKVGIDLAEFGFEIAENFKKEYEYAMA